MSTYYRDPKLSRAEQEERDADIRGKIEQVRVEFPRAGYRPMMHYIRRQGIFIGERRIRSVIKKFELQIRPRRRFVKTTDSNHQYFIYPNLLPEMQVTAPNQV